MSNSLNKKLRGKTIKIFGPPGTGKTEKLTQKSFKGISNKEYHRPKYVTYLLQIKPLMNALVELGKNLKNMMRMILYTFEHYILWPDNSFAEIPVLDPRADLLMFHTQYGTVKNKF